jgi:hypothetical protein
MLPEALLADLCRLQKRRQILAFRANVIVDSLPYALGPNGVGGGKMVLANGTNGVFV